MRRPSSAVGAAAAIILLLGSTAQPVQTQARRTPRATLGIPQDKTGGDFEFSGTQLNPEPMQFEAIASAAELSWDIRRSKVKRFGPFTPEASGFRQVTVYLGRSDVPKEERGLADQAEVGIAVSTVDHRGRSQWWRLGEEDRSSFSFDISDEPAEGEQLDYAVDPTTALIRVDFGSTYMGANTYATSWSQWLLDFRGTVPQVLTTFEAWVADGGGACGAYDMQYTLSHDIGCAWDPARRDFLCTDLGVRADTLWAERRLRRQFWLGNGTGVVPVVQKEQTQQIASDILESTTFRVLAAPGIGLRFDARFSVSADAPDGPPTIVLPRHSGRLPEDETTSNFVVQEQGDEVAEHPAEFRTTPLGTFSGAHIYRVEVTEGRGRGIYLLSVARVDGRIALDTLLLATDARHYDACALSIAPTTAAAIRTVGPPLPIEVDVEPPHSLSIFDEDDIAGERLRDSPLPHLPLFKEPASNRPCAWQGSVTWDRERGFVVERVRGECDQFPRAVTIDADGALRVTGGLQETEGRREGEGVTYLALGPRRPEAVLLLPDPDYDLRLWLELMDKLASTHTVVAFSPALRTEGDDATIVRTLAGDIQEVVGAIGAKRVFVIAHGLSVPYALEWAKAHADLAAGVLTIRSPEPLWFKATRVRALTGSDADRLRYLKEKEQLADKIAPFMLDRSGGLTLGWFKTFAALLSYPERETLSDWKGAQIWDSSGRRPALGGFFPMVSPSQATLTALDQMLVTAFGPRK